MRRLRQKQHCLMEEFQVQCLVDTSNVNMQFHITFIVSISKGNGGCLEIMNSTWSNSIEIAKLLTGTSENEKMTNITQQTQRKIEGRLPVNINSTEIKWSNNPIKPLTESSSCAIFSLHSICSLLLIPANIAILK